MKEVYQRKKEELLEIYGGSTEGHPQERAEAVLAEHGENVLEEQGKRSVLQVFFQQFADLLVMILLAASVISMISGNAESTIVIFAVLLMNAVLGTVQYVKAEKSLTSLKNLSAPKAKVLRDGMKREIPSREIVPGDVMLLEAGDLVAADGRILENYSLKVNESALTGEAENVEKKDEEITEETALGDRYNMVFSGSLVTYGRAKVLVTSTGMDTEMGHIARLMNQIREKKTPLQVSLDDFSKKLAAVIIVISALVFCLRIFQQESVLDSLMFAVALAVAAIPEALGSIVTIVQAVGTAKMVQDQAIIKDLKAVESLGCVSVICSDKTGTLTQNKMTVKELFLDQQCFRPEELDPASRVHRYFLYNAVLNNDSDIRGGQHIGDPTETCLLSMAQKAGIKEKVLRDQIPRLEELPFDSERKLMSSKYDLEGETILFTKGALDVLMDRMEAILTSSGKRKLTEADREKICLQNQRFSENGMRVLAFVYRECRQREDLSAECEAGYTFLGLAAMVDPPREESVQAVADAVSAGIRPIMITGDHKVTATAIAKQIGIFRDGDLTVTGQELDTMTDEILDERLEDISVYARVSPEHKIRIVHAWQKRGHVVAMTGDGVNDAPALKKADIGVAMGITGTEVSKDAAAMILADDNFATIIKAVLNGRNVYRNIMNAILFLLSGNLAAILTVLFCSAAALDTPFLPVHLLFINLITDSLPALAIGMESSDPQLLRERPRNPKEGILTKEFSFRLCSYGVLITAAVLAAYGKGAMVNESVASTMAFATLTLARLFHGFTCRSRFSVIKIGFCSNLFSLGAFGLGTLLLVMVLKVGFLQKLFEVQNLNAALLGWIIFLAFLPTLFIQTVRIIRENIEDHKKS